MTPPSLFPSNQPRTQIPWAIPFLPAPGEGAELRPINPDAQPMMFVPSGLSTQAQDPDSPKKLSKEIPAFKVLSSETGGKLKYSLVALSRKLNPHYDDKSFNEEEWTVGRLAGLYLNTKEHPELLSDPIVKDAFEKAETALRELKNSTHSNNHPLALYIDGVLNTAVNARPKSPSTTPPSPSNITTPQTSEVFFNGHPEVSGAVKGFLVGALGKKDGEEKFNENWTPQRFMKLISLILKRPDRVAFFSGISDKIENFLSSLVTNSNLTKPTTFVNPSVPADSTKAIPADPSSRATKKAGENPPGETLFNEMGKWQ